MRRRGQKYWDWAEADIHVRNHDERLGSGVLINVQVRHSPVHGTQLFIGVYGDKGIMRVEEIYETRPSESMTQASEWGLARAKKLLGPELSPPISGIKAESLPRKGSRLHKQ
jgi:hypothetical protein